MELIKQNSQSKLIKSLFLIILGSIALTISAKIKIPFYPVPMTMQTFVIFLIGMTYGVRLSFATVALYLLECLDCHINLVRFVLVLTHLLLQSYHESV